MPHPQVSRPIPLRDGRGLLVIFICIFLAALPLLLRSEPPPETRGVMIATELDQDGRILKDSRLIPAGAGTIYLQFHLATQTNVETPLEFRWYEDDRLIYSSTGTYQEGLVTTSFEIILFSLEGISVGNYHVEAWFEDSRILYKPFAVR
jgi:hypothetical protein